MKKMNKEDKMTFQDLADWLDRPLSNDDIDLINFILTSIENRYKHIELQQKVNQLETNRDEAIKELETLRNRLLYEEDFCMEEIHIDEAKEILERGKEC